MALNRLICHYLCSAAATHTLLLEQNVVSGRLSRFNRHSLAILIAAVLLWFELPDLQTSHYATLGLPVGASHYEIMAQHSRIKMEIQRNGQPADIAQIKRAFDVLANENKRKMYNMFGDLESELIGDVNLPVVATALAFAYHILSCIMSFALFRANSISLTRYIMGMYSAIAFAVEIESRFISNSSLFESVFYLNSLLPFQRVMLVRGIPPALGLILNLLCVNFYTDTEKLNQSLWQSAVSTNRIIMEKMADVVEATNFVKSRAVSSSASIKLTSSEGDQRRVSMQIVDYQWAILPLHIDIIYTCIEIIWHKNADKTIAKDVLSTENLMEIVQSMDESQRQKVIDLFKAAAAKGTEKKADGGWVDTLKGPVTYLMIFVALRYLSS
ncbi:hypothetical protein X943_003872 [Babesia divergens]|uniref:J domain-containing protein n=1 Tax=Babesia divergens TaxID=32595 RepID=A0AAD9GDP4_BABDI|nr:hypothetical protein X943_003872 [Babesia divergens]